jgi:peptidoglycan/LPS O-acetylase OafA/YrhL
VGLTKSFILPHNKSKRSRLKLRLARITDGRKIIPEIEGLRFVSILLVVFSHIHNNTIRVYPTQYQQAANAALGTFLEECGNGVNIFFFISGFILAIPFLRDYVHDEQRVSLKHYYYRRVTRIEPPYIISLTFFLLVAIFIMHQGFGDAISHYIASALYSHNIVYDHISTINPVAWTLEIEVQYYVIAPLIAIALFFKNDFIRTILLLSLFILSSNLYFQHSSFFEEHHLQKSLFAYGSIFITGIIVADWYLKEKNFRSGTKHVVFDILGLAAIYCIVTLSGYQGTGYRLFLFACYWMMFVSIFKGAFLNKILTTRWITIVGGMCYSVYLVHYAVTFFITQSFTKNILSYNYPRDILMQGAIVIPFILIASAIFFVLFERPFMDINWPNKLKISWQKLLRYIFLNTKTGDD